MISLRLPMRVAFAGLAAVLLGLPVLARAVEPAPVTLAQDADTFILDNGIITARVAKASGDLVSLRFRGLEMLATFLKPDGFPDLQKDPPGANPNGLNRGMTDHQYAFWSHDAMGPRGTESAVTRVTIDPASNHGARAEVSVKGVAKGRAMGTGPGAKPDGQFAADVEIRYALGRGDSAVATYCIFEHRPEYPASSIAEARFCAKLNEFFDWMSVSPARNQAYPKDLHEGDKYVYTVVQSENPAFGWSSTTRKVGFWILNPSMEYMSGGPTKVEFQGHRDTNAVAAPCVLNYWRSSHYGGAEASVAAGEAWTKVVGPFLLYVNAGDTPQAMFDDARARQGKVAAEWPFDWVEGVDYPHAADRATVRGRVLLQDPQAKPGAFSKLRVGLTAPAWPSSRPVAAGSTGPAMVDWQTDAKHYQFWTEANADGRFEIPKVRPGSYTLHAFADSVLGELARADVNVPKGKTIDLGDIVWAPVRRGRTLWEIGVPNRGATEFYKAEDYWRPEISLTYAQLFPNDVTFVVGRSDWRKDWFFQHVPHNEDPAAKPQPFFGVRSPGRATPFTVQFDLPSSPKGVVTLRLALCGTGARSLDVSVNGQPAGRLEQLPGDGVIVRHGLRGLWYEREVAFSASLLKAGENRLVLTVPAGPVNDGLVYDYLRLELDESATLPVAPASSKMPALAPDLASNPAPTAKPLNPALPSLFVAGDSTAAKGKGETQQGWGVPFADYFDPAKVNVVNRARGGRSARTYLTEGLWDQLLADVKPGDVVLIQFGHNDGSPFNEGRARGSLPGLGEETQTIENIVTKKTEVVHTFGWYLRKMIADVKEKKATPILLSLTIRNVWKDGHLERGSGLFGQWSHDTAIATAVQFVDLTTIMADQLEPMGEEAVKALYPQDHTHFNAKGADLHAAGVVSGLKGLDWKKQPGPVKGLLSDKGEAVAPETTAWLKLPVPARRELPTLFLVGDSTVRNGVGDGIDGQWGWGDSLPAFFELSKLNIVNRAVGGTSSRSFRNTGYWDRVLKMMKPGDFVIIQFGHNDNGDRGGLKGSGEETEVRTDEKTKQAETVHTFGWYLRQYIADTRARGATPILCSLVPRKKWVDGRMTRNKDTHAGWAEQVAQSEHVPFLDLNERIAQQYDALGQEKVNALFADEHTHTTKAGADLNARVVVEALQALPQNPLAPYLKPQVK